MNEGKSEKVGPSASGTFDTLFETDNPQAFYASVVRVASRHADMLALLKELEWGGPWKCNPRCPVCAWSPEDGHEPSCRLAAVLRQAAGQDFNDPVREPETSKGNSR